MFFTKLRTFGALVFQILFSVLSLLLPSGTLRTYVRPLDITPQVTEE